MTTPAPQTQRPQLKEQAPLSQRDKTILGLVGLTAGVVVLAGVALFSAVRQSPARS